MKKYAICDEVIDNKKTAGRFLQPWIEKGAESFKTLKEIPDDFILISFHHPPWRSPYAEWIAKGNKHIEIDYGYWGLNEPRRNTRRVTYCESHNLNLKSSVPFSRLHTLNPPVNTWNQNRGDHLLIIEPQSKVIHERTGKYLEEWKDKISNIISPHWDGPVKWRRKAGGKNSGRWPSFLEDLSVSHAVIGERTMACVEAVILGWPAYTIDFSAVSLLMGNDISEIKNPKFPDRHKWLEHISWSQFLPEEFQQGTLVADLVEMYQIS